MDSFTDNDLAIEDRLGEDDAQAAERIGTALIALREKSHRDVAEWAAALGVEQDELRLMENAQTIDRPTAAFLLRAVLLCAGTLKISFGKNDRAIVI